MSPWKDWEKHMASYKQVVQLVRQGKSPSEIIAALNIYPSRLAQMMDGPRFKRLLQSDLELTEILSQTVQMFAAGEAAGKLVNLVAANDEKVALQASLAILREVDKPHRGLLGTQPGQGCM